MKMSGYSSVSADAKNSRARIEHVVGPDLSAVRSDDDGDYDEADDLNPKYSAMGVIPSRANTPLGE